MSQCQKAASPGSTSGIPVSRLLEQRVPALVGREHLVDRDPAHVVFRHVVEQGSQHQVGHRLWDGHGVQHALVVPHGAERRPALEGTEDGAHRRARVLRGLGAIGGVPRIVGGDIAGEQVPEVALVALRHPEVEGAGIEMGAEARRARAGGPTSDAVGVERGAIRVEPASALGLAGPAGVQERLDGGHPGMLARLHLRRRPVDRVELRLGLHRTEEVVGRAAVLGEKVIRLDVVHDRSVPGLGLGPREQLPDQGAPSAPHSRNELGRDLSGLDVAKVDDRPDRLASGLRRLDLRHLGAERRAPPLRKPRPPTGPKRRSWPASPVSLRRWRPGCRRGRSPSAVVQRLWRS